jgi:ABC-type arginine transport system permease subunit
LRCRPGGRAGFAGAAVLSVRAVALALVAFLLAAAAGAVGAWADVAQASAARWWLLVLFSTVLGIGTVVAGAMTAIRATAHPGLRFLVGFIIFLVVSLVGSWTFTSVEDRYCHSRTCATD